MPIRCESKGTGHECPESEGRHAAVLFAIVGFERALKASDSGMVWLGSSLDEFAATMKRTSEPPYQTAPIPVHVGVRLRRRPGFDIRDSFMYLTSRLAAGLLAALMCWTAPASAQQAMPPEPPQYPQQQPPQYPQQQPPPDLPPPQRGPAIAQGPADYGPDELVGAGHRFFGNVSRGLASVIE